jgi:DNA-binding GntR family transcriptional regulator
MTTDANRAYHLIKTKIISLELAPGSVVQDAALVEQLKLGRTPIREALKLLEAENLIVTVPRRGIFVSHVSITDLQQLCEVRIEIEGLSARLAAQRATEGEIAQLMQYTEEHVIAEIGGTWQRIVLDRALHMGLVEAAHNKFLEAEVERFYDLSQRLWHLALERVQASDVNVVLHLDIAEAVRDRDEERAAAMMRDHIRDFQQRVKAAM